MGRVAHEDVVATLVAPNAWSQDTDVLDPTQETMAAVDYLEWLALAYAYPGKWIKTPALVKRSWLYRAKVGLSPFISQQVVDVAYRAAQRTRPDGSREYDAGSAGWGWGYVKGRGVESRIERFEPDFYRQWVERALTNFDPVFEDPSRNVMVSAENEFIYGWLDTVRGTVGEWIRSPRMVKTTIPGSIKAGMGYGARPGEFNAVARHFCGDIDAWREDPSVHPPAGYAWMFAMHLNAPDPDAPPVDTALRMDLPPTNKTQAKLESRASTPEYLKIPLSEFLQDIRNSQDPTVERVLQYGAVKPPPRVVERIQTGASFGVRRDEFAARLEIKLNLLGAPEKFLYVNVRPEYIARHPGYPVVTSELTVEDRRDIADALEDLRRARAGEPYLQNVAEFSVDNLADSGTGEVISPLELAKSLTEGITLPANEAMDHADPSVDTAAKPLTPDGRPLWT